MKTIINFLKEDGGAGLAEYAILLLLIALVCIAVLGAIGGSLNQMFTAMVNAL